MANQQLVEYIKQQVQLGVAKDAIKNTLTTSGWPEADIMDAMNSAAPSAAAQPSSQMTSDIYQPKSGATVAVKTAEPAKKPETQFQAKIEARSTSATAAASPAAMPAGNMMSAAKSSGGGIKKFILPGVLGLLALIFVGASVYLYLQNSSLNEDLQTGSQSNGDLTRQVAALTQDKSNLTGQIQTLTDTNANLAENLSFFVGNGTTSTVSATVKGTLKGDDKAGYTLTLDNGVVLNLRNAKDSRVKPMIASLLNNGLQVTATYVPGTRDLTITAVNGAQIPAEVAASTSTATTASAPAPAASSSGQ